MGVRFVDLRTSIGYLRVYVVPGDMSSVTFPVDSIMEGSTCAICKIASQNIEAATVDSFVIYGKSGIEYEARNVSNDIRIYFAPNQYKTIYEQGSGSFTIPIFWEHADDSHTYTGTTRTFYLSNTSQYTITATSVGATTPGYYVANLKRDWTVNRPSTTAGVISAGIKDILEGAREIGGYYESGGVSGPGGGDGTFDFSSTPIDFQGLPNIGAYATGMIDLYVPSASQLQALSDYLWAGAFDPDNFKKLFADPMDAILGLSIVPVTAAQIGTSAATLAVGNISTELSMPIALAQYVSIDCGSVNVLPKWGAYLDFSPYSKLQLFLPYIGFVAISPDDCMNGSISVRYSVDILSGTCVAQVKCNDHVLYELAGTCSVACPVTAGQYQNIALTALRTVGSVAGTLAAAAAGNVGGVTAGIEDAANSVIASAKPEIQRSGGFGGSSGLMGHQIPFLVLTIPKMCTPGQQNKYIGYPSFVTLALSDITGFTSVEAIHLENIAGACDDDIAEIDALLKEGVFL